MSDRDNSGALFRNTDKGGNDKRPDWTGDAMINGKKVRLAGWDREGRKGPWISVSISEWQERGERSPAPAQQPRGGGGTKHDLDDAIPFGPAKG